MKIYKLTFDTEQQYNDAIQHLKDEEGNWLPVMYGEPVNVTNVITGYTEATEETPAEPIYSEKYHVDMILSEPSGMEQYIDTAITAGHYAHSFVGCSFEVAQPINN